MNTMAISMLSLAQAAAPASQGPGDTPWMVYAIIAFAMAVALLIVEAFMPSGGVLGLLAAILSVAGIVMFFMFDTTWGMISMAVTLAAAPFVVAGMLWLVPNTPIGQAMILQGSGRDESDESSEDDSEPGITVGQEGVALTELRPVGACRLNGKRIDCIANHGVIENGSAVRVVEVTKFEVKVKAV